MVRPDSFVGIVLGNTKLRGSTMAIDRIVMRMAQKLGLELEFKYERPYYRRRLNPKRNRHSARIDADVFVVLRKIA